MKALVTGGCKGLGLAFTKELLSRGYLVYALYNKSVDTALELENNYDNVRSIKCDIRDEKSVDNVLFNIEDIDILINNAGIACDNHYLDKSKKEFMNVLETNVVGTFLVTKYALSKMKDKSIIINISSDNALDANTTLSMDYDVSKAGVNMLTKDFSEVIKEEEKDIRIVSICPGWINTLEEGNCNPNYIKENMLKHGQKEILDKSELVRYILNNMGNYKNGDIIEIKNMES